MFSFFKFKIDSHILINLEYYLFTNQIKMRYNLIVAYTHSERGIGLKNTLPWFIKKDLNYFKNITSNVPEDETNTDKIIYQNAVIMGRKTWDSINSKYKPLKNRINIILTTNQERYQDKTNPYIRYTNFKNLEETIIQFNEAHIKNKEGDIIQIYTSFIIGGESIYTLALEHLKIDKIYATEIYSKVKIECDTFFPNFSIINKYSDLNLKEETEEGGSKYILLSSSHLFSENSLYFRFFEYQNKLNYASSNHKHYINQEENNYLEVMKSIIENGVLRGDRTGTGTYSLFGKQLKYDLGTTFPISTTKKIFLRGVFEELMLYLRGQTDNKILNSKKIHIWNGNTSREFLDKRGLKEYQEGDMGETYGFNFRHFGGDYQGCQIEYDTNVGYDQLMNVIYLIKNNPESRRIIINLWNPQTLHKAALPSCLCMYQFYVNTIEKKLNLMIYIRSSDYFLANNWNTCTGALLVHMICRLKEIDLTPGELTVTTGDTHIYQNHLEQVQLNLDRIPQPFPKLVVMEEKESIEEFEFSDFWLVGYKYQANISAPMAV